MTDEELLALVEQQERDATDWATGELASERERTMRYFKRDSTLPEFGADPGRSKVITSEVADALEIATPAILKPFVTTDRVGEFQPQGIEDEQGAKQATEAVQFVFAQQNPAILILTSAVKDAFLGKNCYARVYYDEPKPVREKYEHISMEELLLMAQKNPTAQIVEQEQEEDGTISVTIETYGPPKVCVEPIPPEQVFVHKDWHKVSLDGCPFVSVKTERTIGELRDMGYDVPDNLPGEEGYGAETMEIALRRGDDYQMDTQGRDPTMRRVWTSECFIRCDKNGDGKAELLRVVKAGRMLLESEEVDVINIAAGTMNLNPHRHWGIADGSLAEDLQLISTALLRQTLDNLYLSNNPRMAVLSDRTGAPQANMDDLLNVRPGGIVREFVPNAVRPVEIPFFAQHSYGMLEYVEQMGEKRHGFSRNLAGMNPDSLNQTARGAMILQSNAQERIEFRARIFGETFVKDVYRLILYTLTNSGLKEFVYRLRDQFFAVDPRQWKQGWDMTIHVGLGSGAAKDQQLMHLMAIRNNMLQWLQTPFGPQLVTPDRVFNLESRIAENSGFKDPTKFWADPNSDETKQRMAQMPPPPPPPEMVKLQMEQQKTQMELQADAVKGQQDMALEEQKAQQEFALEQARLQLEALKTQAQIEIERAKAASQMQLKQAEVQANMAMKAQQAQVEQEMAADNHVRENERSDREMDRFEALAKQFEAGIGQIVQQLKAPRSIVRGKDGRATGIQ